jgi:3',5'-nucleoside bisphosphate phosphatase
MSKHYDLHIHSKLSPCASDEMTVNNIINMAKICGLDIISVCDHNSMRQQLMLSQLASRQGIEYWFGTEVSTAEGVHVLCYFFVAEVVNQFQQFISEHQLPITNNINYFGHQWIYDQDDQIVAEEPTLLISELTCTINEVIDKVHQLNGKCVAAHLYHVNHGLLRVLGLIPSDLMLDGVEVVNWEQEQRFRLEYPQLKDWPVLINSDAHQLIDIKEDSDDLPQSVARWRLSDE